MPISSQRELHNVHYQTGVLQQRADLLRTWYPWAVDLPVFFRNTWSPRLLSHSTAIPGPSFASKLRSWFVATHNGVWWSWRMSEGAPWVGLWPWAARRWWYFFFCAFVAERYGWTPAHTATWNGHEGCLDVLKDAGCDLGLVDRRGITPAHWAAYNGHKGCLRLLKNAGCDLVHADNDGQTPAHMAAKSGQVDCLRLLKEAGCDLGWLSDTKGQ